MFQLPSNRATRLGLNILILLAGGVGLRLCQTLFVPLVIAILLACVLAPMAVWLNRHLQIRWSLACITSVIGMIVFTLNISLVMFASVSGLVGELEPRKLSETIEKFLKKVNDVSPFAIPERDGNEAPPDAHAPGAALARERNRFGPTEEEIKQFVKEQRPDVLKSAGALSLEWTFMWFFILFLLFFLLLEGPTLARRVVDIFGPSEELKEKAKHVLVETAQQIRIYIVWRTIINIGLGLVVGAVFHLGGLRQAWAWGFLLAVLNYIPYLGPFLAGLPPLVDGFVHVDSLWLFFALCAVYWGVIILEGYLIVPVVMGRSMDLNATTVMLACLFWDLIWGATGLFLAMPIMAGVKSICTHVPGWLQWANLMSSKEIAAPPEPGTPIAAPLGAAASEPGAPVTPPMPTEPSPNGAVGTSEPQVHKV